MDELKLHEIQLLQDMAPWASKDLWDTTRWILYATCPPKHTKKIEDFFPLYTDNDTGKPLERLEGEELNDVRKRIIQAFSKKNMRPKQNGEETII